MSEAIMAADMSTLAALRSVFGCADTAAPAENGAFGQLLGAMMNPVTAENPDAVEIIAAEESETQAYEGIAAVIAALATDSVSVPNGEIFTPEGAKAFIGTLEKFLSEGEISPEDIKELWKDVSDEEKSLYADLLLTLAGNDIPEGANELFENVSHEITVNDIISAAVSECVKTLSPKSEKKDEKKEISPEAAAAYFAVMEIKAPIEAASSEESEVAMTAVGAARNDEVSADVGQTALLDVDAGENIQIVYNKLENADPDDLKQFCETAAKELNAEITVSPKAAPENEGTSEKISVSDMFGSGRQAVMARMGKPLENAEEISVMQNFRSIVPETAEEIPVEVTDTSEISRRIIERINMLEAYESESVGEITMKLSPEELGGIKVKITGSGDGLVIAFAAEKSEAARLIGDRAAALAEALAARGVNLKEMSVTQQITAEHSENSALDYMGRESGNPSNGYQNGSRRFVFGENGMTGEVIGDSGESEDSEIYYNREAKLWVSA